VTTAGPNLVKDPEFVHGTAAWSVASGGRLATLSGYDGHRAISVLNTTSAARTLGINDRANTVAATHAGAVYRASAWIKTWSTIAGGTRQMEFTGTSYKGGKVSSARFSSSAWKRVRVDYTAATAGASIDFNILAWALPARTHLLMSKPRLVRLTTTTRASTSLAGWTPRLVENFTTISGTRWTVRNGLSNGNEDSNLFAANVSTTNGVLKIQGKHQTTTTNTGGTRKYTSGYLDSKGKITLPSYFRAEVRAKVPYEQGMWAAPLWFRPNNGGDAEIDMIETWGRDDARPIWTQTLWHSYSPSVHSGKSGLMSALGDKSGTAWHTYVVEKTPGHIDMWIDGVKSASWSSATPGWFKGDYDSGKTWNMRINLQIGGSWGGRPDSTTDWAPAKTAMLVDYVHTWSMN
jgi:hypothetical protein